MFLHLLSVFLLLVSQNGNAGETSLNGFSSMNGFNSLNGMNGINGLAGTNGLLAANGLITINGLNSQNGLRSRNGFNSLNGVVLSNGLSALDPQLTGMNSVQKEFVNWLDYPFGVPASESKPRQIRRAWQLRDSSFASTQQGRDILKYFARCALEEGQALVADVDGKLNVFPGVIGLAPKWVKRPLTLSEQRWVSACLLAHVNMHGVHVPINIRGPHPKLRDLTAEDKKFKIEEGAFFGNLFDSKDDKFTCVGNRHEKDDLSKFLRLRNCTELSEEKPARTVCDFGLCGACDGANAICARGPGYFKSCRDPASGREYREVVTIYLQQ
jgi:hypothetical protein